MRLCGNPGPLQSDHACLVLLWLQKNPKIITMIQPWKRSENPGSAGNLTSALWNHPSGRKNSSHPTRQENPSDRGMIRLRVVLIYIMEAPVRQGIGIKWTLHCKIPVCFEIKRSRHTERHSCKGQRAASAHIRSIFHQWISNITTKHSFSLVFKASKSDFRPASLLCSGRAPWPEPLPSAPGWPGSRHRSACAARAWTSPPVWGSRSRCCAPWWEGTGQSSWWPPESWAGGACGCHWQTMSSLPSWAARGGTAGLSLAPWPPYCGRVLRSGPVRGRVRHERRWRRSDGCLRCSVCRSWCRSWVWGCASSGCCRCWSTSACRSLRTRRLRGKPSLTMTSWEEGHPLCSEKLWRCQWY